MSAKKKSFFTLRNLFGLLIAVIVVTALVWVLNPSNEIVIENSNPEIICDESACNGYACDPLANSCYTSCGSIECASGYTCSDGACITQTYAPEIQPAIFGSFTKWIFYRN